MTAALAVADAVGAGRFSLFGASQGGQLAAAVAALHPDRVEALALYGMCASGSDLAPAAVRDSVVALVRAHWGLGLKALAGAFVTDPIPLPGSSHLFYHGDWPAVLDALVGFLCEPPSAGPRLTGRELQVAGLVADGLTNQAIARRLSVAPRTAESHVENIRRKLQVRSRAQIAAWVTEHRLRG